MAHEEPIVLLDNLANLTTLTEEAIMFQLKARYEKKLIYGYVGDIIYAINPYERLPLYGPETQNLYLAPNVQKTDVPPHAYMLATCAYENMLRNKEKQCVVISGESGAGKSETTKHIVAHLMEMCRSGKKDLEERIKVVSEMLESFGNSKTVMNNNSSRFGKYLELRFDSHGGITGATLTSYLLEKSRVCMRNANEQNFHIFYQMFAGFTAEGTMEQFGLGVPSETLYLQGVGAPTDDAVFGKKFVDDWNSLMHGMKLLGFDKAEVNSMLKCCAAVLLIGDTTFEEQGDGVKLVFKPGKLEKAASMLEVEAQMLKNCLMYTTLITRGEATQKLFNVVSATDNRNSLAKAIFNHVFDWVFYFCNQALSDENNGPAGGHGRKTEATKGLLYTTIGVLDIFGFEVFKNNSIEQMCINVTNEQLQNFFNKFIFEMEQVEYSAEGIDVSSITFSQNQSTLDLFLKKNPMGIFSLLDDECKGPKGSDVGFTQKCITTLGKHESKAFEAPKRAEDCCFTVTHFAGPVKYNCAGFMDKNKDTLSNDSTLCMNSSTSQYVKNLFEEKVPDAPKAKEGTMKQVSTLGSNYRRSLEELVVTLTACYPHFVRCLKPNDKQKPNLFEKELIYRQLSYAGVLATVQIRKQGFSFRLSFPDFVKRYKMMAYKFFETPEPTRESCEHILNKIKLKDYQIGKTKVFMKYFHSDYLAGEAKKHSNALQFLQKVVKGTIARQKYDALVAERRKGLLACSEFLNDVEDKSHFVSGRIGKTQSEDIEKKKKGERDWVKNLAAVAKQEQLIKEQAEQEKKAALLIAEKEPKQVKSKVMNGHFIWVRNEHLTLKVGDLPPRYRKKLHADSGRYYFKDTEEKTTSWVDPRSEKFRKTDPLKCADDELPYGWEEGETSEGVKFYINHLTNTHCKDHPRVETMRKKAADEKKAAEDKVRADKKREIIAELRAKRRRMQVQMVQCIDQEERTEIAARLETLDETIMMEASKLNSVWVASEKLLAAFANKTSSGAKKDPVKYFATRWFQVVHKRAARFH